MLFRLEASILKLFFKSYSVCDNALDFSESALAEESVIINNGIAKMTKDYTASEKFNEVPEFTKAKGFSNVHTVGVEYAVEKDVEVSNPWFASGKAKFKVTPKFQGQGTTSDTDTEKRSVENEKTYSVGQALEIPPCTEYHVTSFVKMAKDYPIDYTGFCKVNG